MKNIIFIKTKIGNFSIDVELNLVEGINCLFGPSGAGKTSIINCVAGLNKPENSKIIIRKYNYKIIPISWKNRKKGKSKFKINELSSMYLFTMFYCLLEKILLSKKK